VKIVILDGHTANPGDLTWDGIRKYGVLTVYERTPADKEEIIKRIGDAEVIFVNKIVMTDEIMSACPNLKMIGETATGYNNIDIASAKKRGIVVCNIPAYSTDSTAQYAISLLLELCGRVGDHNRAVHEGQWCSSVDFCFWNYPLMELNGKTMGIIGFGKIGQAVGRIAKAFGMTVLAAGSRPTPEGEMIAQYVDLDELFARADVISLHCPLFPATKEIIREENIQKMKDGVLIINNGRGPLINEADLAKALASGKVAGAAVDVLSTEPAKEDNPLLKAPNCIITPHISWATRESRSRLVSIMEDNLKAYVNGCPINTVN